MPTMTREDVEEELRRSPLKSIFTKPVLAIGFLVLALILLPLCGMMFETNRAGLYSIRQAAVTGEMTAYTQPGMFPQMFGDVYKYRVSDILYFSKHDQEGAGADDSIEVRFSDGATAKVTGNVRIDLPTDPAKLVEIHKKFRSYDSIIKDTVRQVVSEAVILTAALMTAEES